MTNHTTRNVRHAKAVSMRELDKLWAELVKKRDGGCQIPTHECMGKLDAHHIVTRKNKSTRYLLENGICLCRFHHRFAEKFHKGFDKWIEYKSAKRWQAIQAASRVLSKTGKVYIEQWYEYLQTERKKLG